MKLIVEISDTEYKLLINNSVAASVGSFRFAEIIKNGTPLEECEDCVSRQAMKTELKNCEVVDVRDEDDDLVGYYNADTVDSIVRNLPPVTPQPKIAHVISDEDGNIKCSNCGSHDCWGNYCSECGAKMQGVKE